MERVEKQAFHLIGLKLQSKTTNEGGQSAIDCGNLWQQFEQQSIASGIPGKESDNVYAVYYDYDGDHSSPFAYFIGCRVKPDTEVPDGLDSLMIPEGSYRKLLAKGQMPACISDTWKEIWRSGLKRAYSYDFEVYDERSKDWNNAEVAIFVAGD
jgi:predicted transcriptional regulator YdeE